MKKSSSTKRVSYKENSGDLLKTFNEKRWNYLHHICLIHLEKFVFQEVKHASHLGPIFWCDFSQNICNTPKFETQSHHYGAKQMSLFCTVKIINDGEYEYIYHSSDNTSHDANFVGVVMDELFDKHFEGSIFRVKTDNADSQFKCCWNFAYWLDFSKKKNITVICYYGVAGHGKGLVDSMSAWGVKTPLRKAIINQDFWYLNASDIVVYLKQLFMDDDKKSLRLSRMAVKLN